MCILQKLSGIIGSAVIYKERVNLDAEYLRTNRDLLNF